MRLMGRVLSVLIPAGLGIASSHPVHADATSVPQPAAEPRDQEPAAPYVPFPPPPSQQNGVPGEVCRMCVRGRNTADGQISVPMPQRTAVL